jgi:hypothetical protein
MTLLQNFPLDVVVPSKRAGVATLGAYEYVWDDKWRILAWIGEGTPSAVQAKFWEMAKA